jgi:hypothetical protein
MNRLHRTASVFLKVGLPIAALLLSASTFAAEDTDILTSDDHALQVRFYDNSPYAQVSRIRSLSFLTLANSGKSRWFVGINSDGIFGLHYRATARYERDSSKDSIRPQFLDKYLTLDTY